MSRKRNPTTTYSIRLGDRNLRVLKYFCRFKNIQINSYVEKAILSQLTDDLMFLSKEELVAIWKMVYQIES